MPTRLRTLCRIAIATTLSVTVICGSTRFLLERRARAWAEQNTRVKAAQAFLRAHPVKNPLPEALQETRSLPLEPDWTPPEHHHIDLSSVDCFALGRVGYASMTSVEERELDEILIGSGTARTLLSLSRRRGSSDVGRLYALIGLRWIGSREYRPLLRRLKASRTYVETNINGGCCGLIERVADVARRIDAGEYDKYCPKNQCDDWHLER